MRATLVRPRPHGLDEAHQRVTAVGVAEDTAQVRAGRREPRRVELDAGRPVGEQAQRQTKIGDLGIERGHRAHCWALAARNALRAIGVTVTPRNQRSPEYLGKYITSEIERWAVPIKASGVVVE